VPVDYDIFELGDFTFQNGATLRGAKLTYKSFGTLNAARQLFTRLGTPGSTMTTSG
jgi:homoserine acetyltransferase